MPRIARTTLPDGFFHATSRGVARTAIFHNELDYADFTRELDRVRTAHDWTIHCYCLMPNHYHLIVEATQDDLSRGMHRLNGRYARRFNQRYDRSGHLFQNRFSSYVIEDERHFERALAYVRANPVAAGLCARPEEWPWAEGPVLWD